MGASNGYSSHGELRVGQAREPGQSSPAAEQRPLAGGTLLYRAQQESFSTRFGHCQLTLTKVHGPSKAPEAVSNTREQTLGSESPGRAQDCPVTKISLLVCCSRGERGQKWYLQGLGQLPGTATASFHWSALETE